MDYPRPEISLLQITDSHLFASGTEQLLGINTRYSFQAVLEHIKKSDRRPDHILVTGDIAQDGNLPAYDYFASEISKFNTPVYCLAGNHDDSHQLKLSLSKFARTVVDLASWRLVLLDTSVKGSEHGYLAQDQLDLLQQALQTDKHVLLAMHHNPVPMQSAWLDTMQIGNATDLWAIVNSHKNIRAILWGHVHQEYDSEYMGIRLMSSPSTCFQFLPRSRDFALDTIMPGYRWLDLYANGTIKSEVVRIDSLPLEAGELQLESSGY